MNNRLQVQGSLGRRLRKPRDELFGWQLNWISHEGFMGLSLANLGARIAKAGIDLWREE